ncbi:MAG: DUF1648 domain-containing protein, partial [Thermoplasmata archaeon]
MIFFSSLYFTEAVISIIIGIAIAFVPFMTEKSVVFGVRIPVKKLRSHEIVKSRVVYTVAVVIMTFIILILAYMFRSYTSAAVAMPFSIILLSFGFYLFEHYKILRMKEKEKWIQGESKISGIFIAGSADKFPWAFAIPGLLFLLIMFITGILYYPHIPSTFPTHYGVDGVPNQYSSKSIGSVFMGPLIGSLVFFIMVIIAYAINRTGLKVDNSVIDPAYRADVFRRRMTEIMLVIPIFTDITFLLSSLEEWGVVGNIGNFIITVPIVMAVVVIAVSAFTGQLGSNIKIRNDGNRQSTQGYIENNRDD